MKDLGYAEEDLNARIADTTIDENEKVEMRETLARIADDKEHYKSQKEHAETRMEEMVAERAQMEQEEAAAKEEMKAIAKEEQKWRLQ